MQSGPDLLTTNDTPGVHAPSFYAATANRTTNHPSLSGDFTCDVCVIGGGYTGVSSALHLARRGYDVVLLEANRIGWGASGRNGGQVGVGQRVDQTVLEKRHGLEYAKILWDLAMESMDVTVDLIRRHAIACDLTYGTFFADHRRSYLRDTRKYVDHLQKTYGYNKVSFVGEKDVAGVVASPKYFGGMMDAGSGHLHPLNLVLGLADVAETLGVRIFEDTRVLSYDHGDTVTVHCEAGSLKAKHLILGCNGYLGKLDKTTAARVLPINNFIVATEPLSKGDAETLLPNNPAVADSKHVINYFRLSSDRRMLFGGGENYGYNFPHDIKSFVRGPMVEIFPQLKDVRIDYGWGGTLAITPKRMPYFARLAPNVLTATGYSGHGVAMATLAGKVLAEAVDGTSSRFDAFDKLNIPAFPGGDKLRYPLLVLAMTWYALRDRLGV
ncbi:MAG: FAD-binding oxidoreductase [Rhodobacteraceae bacterium]|nr:FAD-binding oxidoreductase [Paracoccaceae bacterium]